MLLERFTYCFYHYRRLFFHTWIVATFLITLAAAPLQALATPKASACGYLAGLIDEATPGPLFLPSYPTVESGPLHGAAYLYDNAVAAIALMGTTETTAIAIVETAATQHRVSSLRWRLANSVRT